MKAYYATGWDHVIASPYSESGKSSGPINPQKHFIKVYMIFLGSGMDVDAELWLFLPKYGSSAIPITRSKPFLPVSVLTKEAFSRPEAALDEVETCELLLDDGAEGIAIITETCNLPRFNCSSWPAQVGPSIDEDSLPVHRNLDSISGPIDAGLS